MISPTVFHLLTLLNIYQNSYNRHLTGPGKNICPTDAQDFQTEIYPSSLAIHYTSKMHNESLNLKKLTSANGVPAWLLKCFNDELDLVVHNIMSQASFNASIQNHINMQ